MLSKEVGNMLENYGADVRFREWAEGSKSRCTKN